MKEKFVQPRPDVFEMILQSVGTDGALVHANRREADHSDDEWHVPQEEGQLAVDVADNGTDVIVISTMAGADPSKIEVYVHNDLLTIRGVRNRPVGAKARFFHQECFWGAFSRTVVLPVDVIGDGARAEYKSGVLVITIPKRSNDAHIPVVVVDE